MNQDFMGRIHMADQDHGNEMIGVVLKDDPE